MSEEAAHAAKQKNSVKMKDNVKMKNSVKMRNRIPWVDIAKGIAILATIIGHTFSYGTNGRNLIFSFHMPLFFILTGYTIHTVADWQSFWRGLRKDLRYLILPCLGFQAVNLIFSILRYGDVSGQFVHMLKQLYWASAVDHAGHPGIGMLWFLVVLFWAKQMYRLIGLMVKSEFSPVCFFLSACFGKMLSAITWLPQSFDLVFVAVLFIWAGSALRQYEQEIRPYWLILFMVGFVFWMYEVQNGVYIEIGTRSYPDFPLSLVEAVAGSMSIFLLAKAISDIKYCALPLTAIGRNTLIILGVHHLDGWAFPIWGNYGGVSLFLFRILFDLSIAAVLILCRKLVSGCLQKRIA